MESEKIAWLERDFIFVTFRWYKTKSKYMMIAFNNSHRCPDVTFHTLLSFLWTWQLSPTPNFQRSDTETAEPSYVGWNLTLTSWAWCFAEWKDPRCCTSAAIKTSHQVLKHPQDLRWNTHQWGEWLAGVKVPSTRFLEPVMTFNSIQFLQPSDPNALFHHRTSLRLHGKCLEPYK